MTSKTPEDLKKKVEELKKKVAEGKKAGKISKKDPEYRTLKKQLKRTQRRLVILTPLSLEERQKRSQKQLDIISKLLSDMTKNIKKAEANPFVHSLRKKVKSLTKRGKKLNRLIEKKKPKEAAAAPSASSGQAPSAPAAPTPAPAPAPAPEAEKK